MGTDFREGGETGTRIWRAAIASLLADGATPSEALEGAGRILRAYRRHDWSARRRREAEPATVSADVSAEEGAA